MLDHTSFYLSPQSLTSTHFPFGFSQQSKTKASFWRVQAKIFARVPCLFAHFDTQLYIVLYCALISGHSLLSEATTYLREYIQFSLFSPRVNKLLG